MPGMTPETLAVVRAARFAAEAHAGQTRQGSTTPYVLHPLRVAEAVAALPDAPEALVCAALLHDVVEDTPVTLAQVEAAFGPIVAAWVGEVTDQFTAAAYPDWNRAKRKACEVARLSRASREAQILKMLDRLDNLRDTQGMADEFVRRYVVESQALAEALGHTHAVLAQAVRDAACAAVARLPVGDTVSPAGA